MSSFKSGLKRICGAWLKAGGRQATGSYLVPGNRIKERRNALIEECENGRQVDDEGSAERFHIVLLQNVQDLGMRHLACVRNEGEEQTLRAIEIEGFVRSVHDL